jgi:mono/diheme cytochrome c family protein
MYTGIMLRPSLVAAALLAASGCKRPAETGAETGRPLYTAYCSACHGEDGQGAASGIPPLAGSPWVAGSEGRIIRIVLQGVHGSLSVAGKVYSLEMPAFGPVLDDAKVARLLTHVRSRFAGVGPISMEAVSRVRAETASRDAYWTAAELLEVP